MKSYKAKDLLAERFGQKGSEGREQFRESAYSYYFGEIIRNKRKELNMSQEKLAEIVGKKRPYISRIENGDDVKISNLLLVHFITIVCSRPPTSTTNRDILLCVEPVS